MAGKLSLKPREHRRIVAGHCWVFSNEVAAVEDVSAPGDCVRVFSHRGGLLGSAYYNPHTLIAARLYSRADEDLDGDLIGRRLAEAISLRRRLGCAGEAFRLVNSEGDGLPGLIVDVYRDVAVVQILTAGMERVGQAVVEQLAATLPLRAIYERSDSPHRSLEGLKERCGPRTGEAPEVFAIRDGDLQLLVDVVRGQKTGLFLDQFANRRLFGWLLPPGARVLDCFCYTGAWAMTAVAAGASEVVGVDSSQWALEQAKANSRLNDCESACRWMKADAVELLQHWAGERSQHQFDAIVLDPPAFAKSKKHVISARRAYRAINAAAMRLLAPGGLLATCSCSHHIDLATFQSLVVRAACDAGRRCRILARLGQPPDHPAVPAMPETTYLKGFVLEVRPL